MGKRRSTISRWNNSGTETKLWQNVQDVVTVWQVRLSVSWKEVSWEGRRQERQHLLNAYFMPGIAPATSYRLFHWTFTLTLFINLGNWAQRGEVACLRSHSWSVQLEIRPGLSSFRGLPLSPSLRTNDFPTPLSLSLFFGKLTSR